MSASTEGKVPCVWGGCGCCYSGCDCQNPAILCHNQSDCLCLRGAGCIALGVEPRGVGCTTAEGECCKLGLFCCDIGLVSPKVLCAGYHQCLCCVRVQSLPFNPAYQDECVCAIYGLQCAPESQCCGPSPDIPAIAITKAGGTVDPSSKEAMDRGDSAGGDKET